MKIAIDAMGGDYAPEQVVLGAVQAVRQFDCDIVLVGDKDRIEAELAKHKGEGLNRLSIHHTSQVIEMGEHPSKAVVRKKDSSIVVATRLVKEGKCDAVVSAGSTGAAATAATLILGRIKGISRPTIATPLPTQDGVCLLLDSGANVDSKPQHLVQSAMMGSIYSQYIFKVENPRVGLLNIGEEETKGNEQAKATLPLLKQMTTINFNGNAEGRDIPSGRFDVVVCDGFVGNVVLKFAEGLASVLFKLIKDAIQNGGMLAKLGALLVMPALKKLGKRIDVSEYGGAPLLGVDGCTIICHGSSNAKSICSAIGVAERFVSKDVLGHIRESLEKEEMLTNDSKA